MAIFFNVCAGLDNYDVNAIADYSNINNIGDYNKLYSCMSPARPST